MVLVALSFMEKMDLLMYKKKLSKKNLMTCLIFVTLLIQVFKYKFLVAS